MINPIPCKNCGRMLEEHLEKGSMVKKEGAFGFNAANWCYEEVEDVNLDLLDSEGYRRYHMYYEPMGNLDYLEWKHEQTGE